MIRRLLEFLRLRRRPAPLPPPASRWRRLYPGSECFVADLTPEDLRDFGPRREQDRCRGWLDREWIRRRGW